MRGYWSGALALSVIVGLACKDAPKDSAETGPPQSAAMGTPSAVGVYTGTLPAADAGARKFTLTLMTSSEAELLTEYTGKGVVTSRGTWTAAGSDLIITLAPADAIGSPETLEYRIEGDGLTPVQWDSAAWGSEGPPKLRRGN